MLLYVSLGSNLGDRRAKMENALRLLEERVGKVTARSAFYETEPEGFQSENLFVNAAAAVQTELDPHALLRITQQIETELGRTQKSRNGLYADRAIDIDLLMYGNAVTADAELELPHPRLAERLFVLRPLCEIAPELRHPLTGRTVASMLQRRERAHIAPLRTRDLTEGTLERLNALLAQLTSRPVALTAERAAALAENANSSPSRLYLLRPSEFPEAKGKDEMADTEKTTANADGCAANGEGEIVGMATLALYPLPTGTKAWIEDVVIDVAHRNKGFGRLLVEHLVDEARRLRADSVNLTSRPERREANRLYQSVGFKQRSTNVYKLTLHP